jgi:hypothetical protein
MADPPSSPERDERADRGPTAGAPRWVKVSGVIALAIVLLLLIVLFAGGDHGPGRHLSVRGFGGPLPSVAAATQAWR